jgi:hypothetical protein
VTPELSFAIRRTFGIGGGLASTRARELSPVVAMPRDHSYPILMGLDVC